MFRRGVFCLLCTVFCAALLVGCTDSVPAYIPTDTEADILPDTDTDAPPVQDAQTDPPVADGDTASAETDAETTAEETDPPLLRIEVPSPVGTHMDELGEFPFPSEQILVVPSYCPVPAGIIFDVTFVGERAEDTLYIAPESLLVLHVSEGIEPKNVTVSPEDKTVYLTFDDGPSKANTLRVLDILDEYGVKATFFLVGESVEKNPEIVREIYTRGHKIGCHSYTHVYAEIYASAENMKAEIARWEAAVVGALGFLPAERLFRYPGGSTTCKENAIFDMLCVEGYRAYDWNAVNNDCMIHTRPEGMTEEEYMKGSVISTLAYSFRLKTSPHIVLMHDTYAQTADLLAWMIEYMLEQGCTFGTLDMLSSGWVYGGS